MGEDVDAATLGGPKVHDRNGVAHFVARSDVDAALLVRDLIDHLPSNAGQAAPVWRAAEPLVRDPGAFVPEAEPKVYDVRDVVRGIVDGGRLLEWAPRWARNLVCGFARLEGKPVGVVANQPRYLGGVLDAESASKGARFVRTCNAFGLPLLVFVDTPGFMPGTRQEQGGVIRHGAKLVHAFAEATVPKVTVVLRKAFGGAFIAMNARDLGADYAFAWPQATIGVMGAKQAVDHRPPARHRRRRGPGRRARRVRRRLPRRAPHRRGRGRGGLRRRDRRRRPTRAAGWPRRCGRSRASRIPRTG